MYEPTPEVTNDGWRVTTPAKAGFNTTRINELTQWIKENHRYHNTHAVLIAQDTRLVYELYLDGEDGGYGKLMFTLDSIHDLRSITKSINALLMGIALKDNFDRALSTPVTELFMNQGLNFQPGSDQITLFHILTMSVGYQWDQWIIPFSDPGNDRTKLAFVKDPVKTIINLPITHKPGTHWNYNGGLTELLGRFIENITGRRLERFARQTLFEPLSISNFQWIKAENWQPEGWAIASAGLRMRLRDMAKIGSLVLNGGRWQGRQIVPDQWIKLCVEPPIRASQRIASGVFDYGFQWWPGRSNSIPGYKMVAGFGLGGQQLLIVPDLRLIIAVFAGNYTRGGQDLFGWITDQVVFALRTN